MLFVGNFGMGAGEEQSKEVAGLLARHGRLADLLVKLLELARAVHVQAALLTARDDDAGFELIPELRGKDDAAFFVQLGSVGTKEHPRSTPLILRPGFR